LEEHGYDTSQMGLKEVMDPETGSIHSEKDVGKENRPVVEDDLVRDEKGFENEKPEERN
jgi:hypothetical protein